MDKKWVKLSLTFIKSHPLLLLCFYSLSYLLPICLHCPLLRRGAPLIPSQNGDSLARSLPLSIPLKNLRSKASLPANHSWTCPKCTQRQAPACPPPFLTEKQPNALFSPTLGVSFCSEGRHLTQTFSFNRYISSLSVFLLTRPSISPSPVFKLTFTSFSTALPIGRVDALYHTNTTSGTPQNTVLSLHSSGDP